MPFYVKPDPLTRSLKHYPGLGPSPWLAYGLQAARCQTPERGRSEALPFNCVVHKVKPLDRTVGGIRLCLAANVYLTPCSFTSVAFAHSSSRGSKARPNMAKQQHRNQLR